MRVNEASKGDMHVTSQDQAFANMSFLGRGVWVDQLYGNKLAMNMASANLLEIETGAFWADGRYVQVELPTSVEVANGQTGLVRHDLLCLKNKIVSGHDNFSFVVIQGTPAASNPADPTPQNNHISDEYGESYAPIARIALNGLVPTVEMLCSFLPVWSADIDGSRLAKKSVPGDRLEDGTISQDKLDQATRDFLYRIERWNGTIDHSGMNGDRVSITHVTFPKPFSSVPSVSASVNSASPNGANATPSNVSTTGFDFCLYYPSAKNSVSCSWVAIGK